MMLDGRVFCRVTIGESGGPNNDIFICLDDERLVVPSLIN